MTWRVSGIRGQKIDSTDKRRNHTWPHAGPREDPELVRLMLDDKTTIENYRKGTEMPAQEGKGPTLPADRRPEAFTAREWLEDQLMRPLAPDEAQTFGGMAQRRYKAETRRQPYTMRFGPEHSQKTVYLPEDEPLLVKTLAAYRTTGTYLRAEANR